jgi:hypothetical protein
MQFSAATASVTQRLGFGGRRPALVRKVLDPIEREIERFARFNDPKNLYSYCFCAPR